MARLITGGFPQSAKKIKRLVYIKTIYTFAAYRLMEIQIYIPTISVKKSIILDTHVDSTKWTLTTRQSAHT